MHNALLVGLRNRKLEISTEHTKANSREPAYSEALNQNKLNRQGGVQDTESRAGRSYIHVCQGSRCGRDLIYLLSSTTSHFTSLISLFRECGLPRLCHDWP